MVVNACWPLGQLGPLRSLESHLSDNKLVIHPVDATATFPNFNLLLVGLHEIGLIREPATQNVHIPQGHRFFELIHFASSHGAIVFNPDYETSCETDSKTLCQIEIDGPTEEIRFLGAASIEDPYCKHCQSLIGSWYDVVSVWFEDPESFSFSCGKCGESAMPWGLDWKHTNGFGRLGIDIWHVHRGEAIPSPELMEFLAQETGVVWDYFYFHC